MKFLPLTTGILLSAALATRCAQRSTEPQTPPTIIHTQAGDFTPAARDIADLQREVEDILRRAEQTPRVTTVPTGLPPGASARPAIDSSPPELASHHPTVDERAMTRVDTPPQRTRRDTAKMAPGSGRSAAEPPRWRRLSYAGASYAPEAALDPRIDLFSDAARSRGHTYAFVLLNEYPSEAREERLASQRVEIIGPHGRALKVRVPTERDRLQAIAQMSIVEWVGYGPPAIRLAPSLRSAIQRHAEELDDELPIIVNAFDRTALEEIRSALLRSGIPVGRVDTDLLAISTVASQETISQLLRMDSVLYIEPSVPGGGGHDESMAVMGMDYIRTGGPGTRYTGAPVVLGILDSGFMVGDAAATTHRDLNKFGCGRNYTDDAAGVWNDEHGHGTHVLATAAGTGSADSRFRGAAAGLGNTASTRIRAAKIWDSGNRGTLAQELDGHDFMRDAQACNSRRPHLVNLSGGAGGENLAGTDARSRKLDQTVWQQRQTWVTCAGNDGPNEGSLWAPGVAKNALTVGNVMDTGDANTGAIRESSSRGPTGDGRMKPNVVATGTSIRSAEAGTADGYRDMAGCSMATPHVTGIAATVMEHYPEFREHPHLLRAFLMATALPRNNTATPSNNTGTPTSERSTYGLGRVSPYTAHWAHPNPEGWTTHWAWRTISRDNWGYRDIEVPEDATRLVVVMTWDEPAASAGSASAVDYDLDLWVDRAPFCDPDARGQCGEWASQSWVDNVEYVVIENPPAGRYRLKIANWNAPASGVPAALAATIVRGATAPDMEMDLTVSPERPTVRDRVSITTTINNPSWLLSGVHLETVSLPRGVTLERVYTRRKDNVLVEFDDRRGISLGTIAQGDSREATWEFSFDEPGAKAFRFRARSENGGVIEQPIVVNPAMR
ncbi:MAG: S8 family serine peptidase [Ectothiorhodospiraceae bacterium]|nr:S8 family serine peptidase [Ectothiorhodospiraceae bacterium]